MKNFFLAGAVMTLLVSSCSLYTPAKVPPGCAPAHFKYAKCRMPVKYKSPIRQQWWQTFNDRNLDALVEYSFHHNYGYLISIKNIQIARTYVTQNASLWWPQVNLNANLSRNHSMSIFNNQNLFNGTNSGNGGGFPGFGNIYNLGQLFASVTYEIDVWNQIGNTVSQAISDTAASAASSGVVKLTLLNSVVDSYFQIATLNANIANLREQRQVAEKILRLQQAQLRGGLIDASTVDDAKNQVETIKGNLSALEKQKEVTKTALAYLLGEYPEHLFLRTPRSLKRAYYHRLLPAALPSQMLTERPDIQQAYFQVLSAGYVEKQNLANFFPTFNLTGTYGYASTTLSGFTSGNNKFWNYGLNIVAPVFTYQLLSSQYERAKLQYQNAILNYRNVVLNAFKEVDSALVSYQQDYVTLQSYEKTLHNNRDKLSLANAQYRGGLTDYTAYLTTKLMTLQSDYTVNSQQLVVMQDVLQVYKTLGIGLNCTQG